MSGRTPEIIRNLREDHEYKQETIAKYLGVVQQTYSNYEKGHTSLPLDYLVKLTKFYKSLLPKWKKFMPKAKP